MKEKTKENLWKTSKIIWFIIGGIIIFWTSYFFIILQTEKDMATTNQTLMFGLGINNNYILHNNLFINNSC